MNCNELVQKYLDLRAQQRKMFARHKRENEFFKEHLATITSFLMEEVNKTGGRGIITDCGTIFRRENCLPRVFDWNAFYTWLHEHQAYEFLHKRVTVNQVTAFMSEHGGSPPPGIAVDREFEIRIRSSSGKDITDGE